MLVLPARTQPGLDRSIRRWAHLCFFSTPTPLMRLSLTGLQCVKGKRIRRQENRRAIRHYFPFVCVKCRERKICFWIQNQERICYHGVRWRSARWRWERWLENCRKPKEKVRLENELKKRLENKMQRHTRAIFKATLPTTLWSWMFRVMVNLQNGLNLWKVTWWW